MQQTEPANHIHVLYVSSWLRLAPMDPAEHVPPTPTRTWEHSVCEILCSLEYWTMDEVHNPSNSQCSENTVVWCWYTRIFLNANTDKKIMCLSLIMIITMWNKPRHSKHNTHKNGNKEHTRIHYTTVNYPVHQTVSPIWQQSSFHQRTMNTPLCLQYYHWKATLKTPSQESHVNSIFCN